MLHETDKYEVFYDNIVVQFILIKSKPMVESRLLIEGEAKAFIEYYKEILHYQPPGDIDKAVDELCGYYFVKEPA